MSENDKPWWLKTGCSHPAWYPEIPREDWFMAQEIAMDRKLEYMLDRSYWEEAMPW